MVRPGGGFPGNRKPPPVSGPDIGGLCQSSAEIDTILNYADIGTVSKATLGGAHMDIPEGLNTILNSNFGKLLRWGGAHVGFPEGLDTMHVEHQHLNCFSLAQHHWANFRDGMEHTHYGHPEHLGIIVNTNIVRKLFLRQRWGNL